MQSKLAMIIAGVALLCGSLLAVAPMQAQAQTAVTVYANSGWWGGQVRPPYLSPCTFDNPCTIPYGPTYFQINIGGPRRVNDMCWIEANTECAGLCQRGFGYWKACETRRPYIGRGRSAG